MRLENAGVENEETGRHLSYLDGWRGLAIFTVLIGHFWLDAIRPGVSVMGVDLFFVLSGRLMAEILFVRQAPLDTFFVRRFSRIFPGLLFFVASSSLIFMWSSYHHGVLAVLTALTFTINYAMIYFHPVALFDHLWSLCVEEHGYIFLAFIAAFFVRRPAQVAPILLLLGMAALANGVVQSAVLGKGYFAVFWRTDVQVAPMLLSAAFYLFLRDHPELQNRWIAPVALAAAIGLKLWGQGALLSFGIGTVLLALAVATIDCALVAMKGFFQFTILRQLGLLSYSLYLWQQPFYKLLRDDMAPMLVLLGGAMLAGTISFYFIEKPARRYINSYWQSLAIRRRMGLQAS